MRKKLVGSMALGYGTAFGLPLIVYAYARQGRPLYGAARFATIGEMEDYGLFKGDGIIIGKIGGRYITYPGEEFVLVSAPTRSKKTQGMVLANAIEWPDSMLVIDMKDLEIFEASAGWQARMGKKVGVWSPYDDGGRTGQHNFLAYIRPDAAHVVGDLFELSYWWFPDAPDGQGSSSNFFQTQCRNLIVGLGLYLLETPETQMPRTMGQMLRLASGGGEQGLREHIEALITKRQKAGKRLSASCERFLGRVLSCSDSPETFVSIFSTFTGALSMFDDPLVDAATSGCSFDVSRLMYEPMALYAHVPFGKLEQSRILLNAFLSQVVSLNSRRLPKNDPQRRIKCLGLFDELTVAGRINVYAEGIGFLAAYGWRFLSVCQTQAQLAIPYGDKGAEIITDNHGCQIIFAPRRETTAEQYAKDLGTLDERVRSHSRNTGGQGTSTGENVTIQRRNLLTPDEIRYLDEDKLIALFRGLRPVLAEKALVYKDQLLKDRVITPPKIPALNLAAHIARIEMRWRALKPGEGETELIPVEELHGVKVPLRPPGGVVPPEQVDDFIDDFFDGALGDMPAASAAVDAEGENWVEEGDEPQPPAVVVVRQTPATTAATTTPQELAELRGDLDIAVLDETTEGEQDEPTDIAHAADGDAGAGGLRDAAEGAATRREDAQPGKRSGKAGNAGRGRKDPEGNSGAGGRSARVSSRTARR
jgi:type IV secretion system protein VirD4